MPLLWLVGTPVASPLCVKFQEADFGIRSVAFSNKWFVCIWIGWRTTPSPIIDFRGKQICLGQGLLTLRMKSTNLWLKTFYMLWWAPKFTHVKEDLAVFKIGMDEEKSTISVEQYLCCKQGQVIHHMMTVSLCCSFSKLRPTDDTSVEGLWRQTVHNNRGIHSRPKEGQTKGPVLWELGRMDQTVGELFGRSLVFFLTCSQ